MRIKGNRGQTSYDNEEGKEKIQNVKKSSQNLKKKVYKRVEGRKETLKFYLTSHHRCSSVSHLFQLLCLMKWPP